MTIGVESPQLLTAPWSPAYYLPIWYFYIRHSRWMGPDKLKPVKYARPLLLTGTVMSFIVTRDGNFGRIHPYFSPDYDDGGNYEPNKGGVISRFGE